VCVSACVRACVCLHFSLLSATYSTYKKTTTTDSLWPRWGRSALEGSFPPQCAIFPGHLKAWVLRPFSNRARGDTNSVCLCARRYLRYAPTRKTRNLQHIQHLCMPLHFNATSLQTTMIHLRAISILAIAHAACLARTAGPRPSVR